MFCDKLEGQNGVGGRGKVQEGGDTCTCIFVWQKPTQYCKVTILQLKKSKKKKMHTLALCFTGKKKVFLNEIDIIA